MSVVGPAGFYNAPVTKLLVMGNWVLAVLISILQWKPYIHLQLSPHITIHHQFWRLLTCQFVFTSTGDVFFGTMVIYAMRTVERQFGSTKYAAFVLVMIGVATLLEIGALVTGLKLGFRYIPGGPYALVFAMLYQYERLIPVIYRFRVFGVEFNNKSFLYLLSSQVILSDGLHTIVPCLCGLLSGALYRSDVANIKRWRFPPRLVQLAQHYLKPWLITAPSPRTNHALPVERPIAAAFGNTRSNLDAWLNQRLGNPAAATNATETNASSTNDDVMSVGSTASATSSLATHATSSTIAAAGSRSHIDTTTVRQYLDTLTGRAPLSSQDITAPSMDELTLLATMFPDHPRETITNALVAAHNDVNRAVEIMLHTPAPTTSSSSMS
ncbi:hypothetical protein DM01DRAFT_1403798 [Hesseltinella vesiculosa]|uniref:CUE domain-containing protein n=1 Tax=Hesseltinella vesiculosa TaxID=101127 RepID=A0A1X2GVM1_9FUNG|nr:hypothetical protein DM01DRAFT_1403798 [Hesseltinella vesiculosa]